MASVDGMSSVGGSSSGRSYAPEGAASYERDDKNEKNKLAEEVSRLQDRLLSAKGEALARAERRAQLEAELEAVIKAGFEASLEPSVKAPEGPGHEDEDLLRVVQRSRRKPTTALEAELSEQFVAFLDATSTPEEARILRGEADDSDEEKAGEGDDGDGLDLLRKHRVQTKVLVVSGSYECSINVSSSTTFVDIIRMAASYWGIPGDDRADLLLVDERNAIYPPEAVVEQELLGASPRMYLVYTTTPRHEDLRNFDPPALMKRQLEESEPKVQEELLSGSELMTVLPPQSKQILRELPFYLLFLALYVATLYTRRSVGDEYWAQSALRSALVDTRFGTLNSMTFHDIRTVDDLWDWVHGPLETLLYDDVTETSDRDASAPESSGNRTQVVLFYNSIVGGVRLRQQRVLPFSCPVSGAKGILDYVNGCYAQYQQSVRAEQTYGLPPFNTSAAFSFYDRATDTDEPVLRDVSPILGELAFYDPSGYFLELTGNLTQWQSTLSGLRRGKWIDEQTRAIFVQANMYNANYDYYCAASLRFEFTMAGRIWPSAKFSIIRSNVFAHTNGIIAQVLEGLTFLCVLNMLRLWNVNRKLFLDVDRTERSTAQYMRSVYSWLDPIIFLCFIFAFSVRMALAAEPRLLGLNVLPDSKFTELADLSWLSTQAYVTDALLLILTLWRFTKCFTLNYQLSRLLATLQFATTSLLAFLATFAVMLSGFVLLMHTLFGNQLYEFSGFTRSTKALLTLALGTLDLTSLRNVDPLWSSIFLIAYVVTMSFVMLNLVLAILNESYGQAMRSQDVGENNITLRHVWNFVSQRQTREKLTFRERESRSAAADSDSDDEDDE